MSKKKAPPRKGRLPKAVSEKRRKDGKRMFINGLSYADIAEILDTHIDTVKNWSKLDNWEEAKKMHTISISEMRAEILNTLHSLKNGEKPKVSADAIRKIVAAFQELNDKRKNAAYAIENFDTLLDAFISKASEAKSQRERLHILDMMKYTANVAQEVVNKLYIDSIK
ncbi:hypothetical protein HN014_08085 [Aquimarina sp. TRL1]|uniref:terminase gpP N-terminus-related DNA-binding protein n=1 Tax=Aquimarina sp. (strain TRL1) TaxID=2736252 RepID=UPI00158F26B1|nr:phage terminase small subunit-related protein [Aquimarina sp. TRL1]QKX04877.1 hypothetical protein HN014_08085 [Aquimarina sp. TRL1]